MGTHNITLFVSIVFKFNILLYPNNLILINKHGHKKNPLVLFQTILISILF